MTAPLWETERSHAPLTPICSHDSSKENGSMTSKLPPRDQETRDQESTAFPTSDVAKSWHGLPQRAIGPEGLTTLAPWSNLRWGLFVPLVLACNVVTAILAWIIVGLVMR